MLSLHIYYLNHLFCDIHRANCIQISGFSSLYPRFPIKMLKSIIIIRGSMLCIRSYLSVRVTDPIGKEAP